MSDWTSVTTAVEEYMSCNEKVRWDGNHSCGITLRCPWTDRLSVAADILNNVRLWPNGSIGAAGAEATITPAPGEVTVTAGGRLVYEEALVKVTYDTATLGKMETYPSGPHAGEVYSESIEQIIENQTFESTDFRWDNITGNPVKTPMVRQMYGLALKRTLFNMTSIPSAIWDLPGHVNTAAYVSASLGKTFAAETLLFTPASFSRTVYTDGTKKWTISMKLHYKADGWNMFWNKDKSGGAGFSYIYHINGTQYKNFPLADFSSLLY
jgi:hypothetical protein